ncbi:MAG: NAD(+) diphosphatase [Selenomonas sp.]|uniref:NAD(+) diphosphatase n=1 Tax=Selenomonas sp. TaxID=2053611 RepID=UPI0025F6BC6E|nr:NAD(+) diphosphatase [Selenomonas sp.]MCR5757147.1 NAD(+) diphosphatase [Selenomonas sp.]
MIHEIYPHKLQNAFLINPQPKADDIVLCVKENAIMTCNHGGQMNLPTRQDIPEGVTYRFLFSLDQQNVYYVLEEGINLLPNYSYRTIRDIRYEIGSPQELMYLVYTAWHLISWYRNNRFCGRCGHETHHSDKERAVICGKCGQVIYPRIVPAVIAGVTWGDKILLTKYARRNMPFYALVAGFTEIGETLEECVAREVMEETGLKVKNIRYYKSQPWGSVQDLIVGFFCDVAGDANIRLDRNELQEGLWVAREDIVGQTDDWSLTHQMMMTFKAGKEPRI